MYFVVGLGNVGAQYDDTRHNVGFRVVDLLAERNSIKIKKKKAHSLFGLGSIDGKKTTLVRPTTLMNRSGLAAAEMLKKGGEPEQLLVICDDMSLPVGTLRLRSDGGAGGHNGLASVADWLDSNAYPRLRIGIGDRGRMEGADYVLARFKPSERKVIDEAVWQAAEAVELWLAEGIEAAMNRHN